MEHLCAGGGSVRLVGCRRQGSKECVNGVRGSEIGGDAADEGCGLGEGDLWPGSCTVEDDAAFDIAELPVNGEVRRGDAGACPLLAVEENQFWVEGAGAETRAYYLVAAPTARNP